MSDSITPRGTTSVAPAVAEAPAKPARVARNAGGPPKAEETTAPRLAPPTANVEQPEPVTPPRASTRLRVWFEGMLDAILGPASEPRLKRSEVSAGEKAGLLYDYCVTSGRKVSETVHNLYSLGGHYAKDEARPIADPEKINGIPIFFAGLEDHEKAAYCYQHVIEELSREASPVTVESLQATKRTSKYDPWSSYAGRFVRQVTLYVGASLVLMLVLYQQGVLESQEAQWVAFGCLGALVHLLNNALTTTRLQTFELSETRKIWPRLMLGGTFGFVVPWLLSQTSGTSLDPQGPSLSEPGSEVSVYAIAAFFGGYSVRFATGFFERILAALLPDTEAKK